MARSALLLLGLLLVAHAAPAAIYRLGLLAVNTEEGKGVVIYAELEVTGGGEVVVEPAGLVDDMLRVSTVLARDEAAILAGYNPVSVGVKLSIHADTNVGGPSASGFIAATIYDHLTGLEPLVNETTMTGMVSVTGLVLPVAGVRYKVAAAASQGFSRVLLPAPEALAGGSVSDSVEVYAVCDLADAGLALAGAEPYTPVLYWNASRAPGASSFREAVSMFTSYVEKLKPLVSDNETRAKIEKLVEASQRLRDASPYTAASLAFHAAYLAAETVSREKGFDQVEKALGLSLDKALDEAEAAVEARLGEFNGPTCDLWRLLAAAAASYRLELAKEVVGRDDALALLRAVTARLWAETVDGLNGPKLSCSRLVEAVGFIVDYAERSFQYINLLVKHQLVTVGNITLDRWVELMKQRLGENRYPEALGIAAYVISDVESRLASLTSPNCTLVHAERLLQGHWEAVFPAIHLLDYARTYYDRVEKDPDLLAYMSATAAAWAFTARALLLLATQPSKAPQAETPIQQPMAQHAPARQPALLYAAAAAAAIASAATARAGARSGRAAAGSYSYI